MSFYNRSFHFFLGQTKAKTMSFYDTGLMLCTEYLGFESYDMRMSDNEVENKMTCHAEDETEIVETKLRKTMKNVVAFEQKRKFPPPLTSLNGRGHRSFYLRPVRKDGRLELTKVMIDRPEIFHVSRENGRLRLHLVDDSFNNPIRRDLEETVEFDEDNTNGESDQEVDDLSMINDEDNDAAINCHEISLNSDDDDVTYIHDPHDAREWRYKNCYKIMESHNHDENNHYHRHGHHHIHPYHHHNSNDNMHLWSQTYVKSR